MKRALGVDEINRAASEMCTVAQVSLDEVCQMFEQTVSTIHDSEYGSQADSIHFKLRQLYILEGLNTMLLVCQISQKVTTSLK
jgi:hypothetical protein